MREADDDDASSATDEMAGTSISRLTKGGVPCVEETRPVGGPKYYVAAALGGPEYYVAAVSGGRGRRSGHDSTTMLAIYVSTWV